MNGMNGNYEEKLLNWYEVIVLEDVFIKIGIWALFA